MRVTVLLLATLLTTVASLPTTAALHHGPCTHEYIDMALLVPSDYKRGGFGQALGNLGARAGNCIDGTVAWACDQGRCEAIISCDICTVEVAVLP